MQIESSLIANRVHSARPHNIFIEWDSYMLVSFPSVDKDQVANLKFPFLNSGPAKEVTNLNHKINKHELVLKQNVGSDR